MSNIETIQRHLDWPELLAQFAEEAAELSKAALKLRRAHTGVNPTPITEQEALDNLLEEFADVAVCLRVLNITTTENRIRIDEIMSKKIERWASRLEGGQKNAAT